MTYSLLLFPYAIVVIVAVVMSIVSLYHLARFAPMTSTTRLSVYVFIVFFAVILVVTWWALREVPWSQTIEVTLPTVTTPL